MRCVFMLLILTCGCMTAALQPAPAPAAPVREVTLDDYYRSIDYSCAAAEDCEIKDVHNCCGYYPECVNKNADVDAKLVAELCAKKDMGSICGFPSLKSCGCVDGRCVGKS